MNRVAMRWAGAQAVIACLYLFGCEQPPPPPVQAMSVHVLEVRVRDLDRSAALTGDIRARTESDLGFRIAGKVTERLVEVGAPVSRGEVLARLDSGDQHNALKAAQSDLAAAQAALDQTRAQAERQRQLLANGYTTRIQYDNAQRAYRTAQAGIQTAEADLRTAQDALSYTELRADRDGVITAKGAEPGQVVAAGQMVVRLADPKQRDAVFQIPAIGTKLGQGDDAPPVEIRLVDDPTVLDGRIREVSPGVDPVTRTYTVKVALPDDAPAAFALGTAVVGRAKLPPQPVVDLPAPALFQTQAGGPAVWVVDRGKRTVSLRPVSVLQYDTGTVIVSSGLDPGDLVVTGGIQKLRPGQQVSMLQEKEA